MLKDILESLLMELSQVEKDSARRLRHVQRRHYTQVFLTCRDYENAYHSGLTGKRIEEQVKAYKSHRRVFDA